MASRKGRKGGRKKVTHHRRKRGMGAIGSSPIALIGIAALSGAAGQWLGTTVNNVVVKARGTSSLPSWVQALIKAGVPIAGGYFIGTKMIKGAAGSAVMIGAAGAAGVGAAQGLGILSGMGTMKYLAGYERTKALGPGITAPPPSNRMSGFGNMNYLAGAKYH